MAYSVEEVLKQAKLCGYNETMRNSNHTWYGMHHGRFGIHLDLYPTTEEFELVHMEGFFKITTEKCGSFMNEKHFLGMQRQFIELLNIIERGKRA